MRALASLLFVALSFSGCLTEGGAETESLADPAPVATVEPTLIDETFDLLTEPLDKQWKWTMDANMTGKVRLDFAANPTWTNGPESICYRLTWPQGQRSGGNNCGGIISGNVAIGIEGSSILGKETVFKTDLYPNSFTLRVWAPQGPDTATLHVFVATHEV